MAQNLSLKLMQICAILIATGETQILEEMMQTNNDAEEDDATQSKQLCKRSFRRRGSAYR
jgi:hypothetical protein